MRNMWREEKKKQQCAVCLSSIARKLISSECPTMSWKEMTVVFVGEGVVNAINNTF